MTLAEEKALLDGFAKAAGAGEILNIQSLKAAYEKAIGHPTSESTVYNVLKRHDWRKLVPRPFHPDRDIEAQNEYKKRLCTRGKEGQTDRREAWSSAADHVRRRGPLRSDEPSAAVLGTSRRETSGRLPDPM